MEMEDLEMMENLEVFFLLLINFKVRFCRYKDLSFLFRKIFKGHCALYGIMYRKIVAYLRNDEGPCTQRDIAGALPMMNRAVLLGYLRCLVDIGKIKSRDSGKAKVYYL